VVEETRTQMGAGKGKKKTTRTADEEELERLLDGATATPSSRPRITPGPEHDPFTRWWLKAGDELPTPEMARKLRPKLEKDEREYRNTPRNIARSLLDDNPDCPPLKASDFAHISALKGRDVTEDMDLDRVNECLAKEKRARARRRTTPSRTDPKAVMMAYSSNAERKARKAASKRKKAEAKTATPGATGSKKRSKVSGKKAPRSLDRDRKILAEIQGFLEAQVAVRLTPKNAEVVRPGSISPLLPTTTKGRSTTHDPVICLPNWGKASQPLRAMAMGIACGEVGGLDFTLHLGDSGIEYARGVGEITFARRMYKRIGETLAKKAYRGLPAIDFMFFVEQGKGERPHLHGIVLPDSRLTPSKKALLRAAMREAGGTDWKPAGHNNTQAELGSLYGPIGWVGYITKYTEITKAEIGDNVFASSRKITTLGREWYKDARRDRRLLLPGKAVVRP
jgi:hypothetical protein